MLKRFLQKSGLGIRLVVDFNKPLLSKWPWKFVKDDGDFWARVIETKFGTGIVVYSRCSVELWKKNSYRKEEFHGCIRWKIWVELGGEVLAG